MAANKVRTVFVCSECGLESAKWSGRCPECNAWNTFAERTVRPATPAMGRARPSASANPAAATPVRLSDLSADAYPRLDIGIGEFDRVLGGGVVPGSLVLIGGDPGIGKCVAGSTRILDPYSGELRPIADWADDLRPVLSLDEETYRLGVRAAAAFLDQGIQPVVELTTRLGRTLRCTPSHPVLTPEGWRPAGELPPGARIAAPRALPWFGSASMDDQDVRLIAYALSDGSATSQITVTTALPEVERDLQELAAAYGVVLRTYPKPNTRAKRLRFVQARTTRSANRQAVAEALKRVHAASGLSWAAWARAATVSCAMLNAWRRSDCVPSMPELQRLADAVGVAIAELEPNARDQADRMTAVARVLDTVGVRYSKARTKVVPSCIFGLPRPQLALFLKVLFSCDGSVYVNRFGLPGVSYATISERLARDIQHLLLRFGLVARLRTKRATVNGEPYRSFELQLLGVADVQRFLAEIGIWGREVAVAQIAGMALPTRPSTRSDTIPTGVPFWEHLGASTPGVSFRDISAAAGTMLRDRRHERPLPRPTISALAEAYPSEYLQRLAHGDVYWDEVESVTPSGEERVYDITVPPHANFVAEDLVVHNSTLILQTAAAVATGERQVLYVSGEESSHQLKMRARRLGIPGDQLYLLTETNLTDALDAADRIQPELLVIDSIQTVYAPELQNAPGSVAQLRECTLRLMQWAKRSNTPTFIIGHVTKEGEIAGPRLLEHIVDVVLYLEGERFSSYRLLRGVKNRFGAVSEVGVFEMQGSGMISVENPSEVFLAERQNGAIGSVIVPTIEGSRPVLVEVQALASPTAIPTPRRTANGIEFSRLLLIAAVLTKRAAVRLSDQDIIVNVTGGLKVNEPAADLGVALAIASSYRDAVLPGDLVALGEIGLSGELRSVSHLDRRLAEAEKLGFGSALVPRAALRRGKPATSLNLIPADTLREALDTACGEGSQAELDPLDQAMQPAAPRGRRQFARR